MFFTTDQNGINPSITVDKGATLSGGSVILETAEANNSGTISSSSFLAVDNQTGPQGLTFGGSGGTWTAGTVLSASSTNNVDLSGLFNANQTVTLHDAQFDAFAGGSITAAAAETAINTNGGQINMFAGVGYNQNTLQVTPGNGGNITFTGGFNTTNAGGNGGDVNVFAYNNGTNATGNVKLGAITTGGSGTNTNGNVIVVGGGSAANNVQVASVDTTGGTGANSGFIYVGTQLPTNNPIQLNINGTLASVLSGGPAQLGNVSTGNLHRPKALSTHLQSATSPPECSRHPLALCSWTLKLRAVERSRRIA